MEEILSSIKRIIAEEDAAPPPRPPRRASSSNAPSAGAREIADDDHILELTDALPGDSDASVEAVPVREEPVMPAPAKPAKAEAAKVEKAEPKSARAKPAPAAPVAPSVLSPDSAKAARESLVHLSKLLIRPDDAQSNTLEGLVREMLRPMLKDWLDANLPTLVEGMVKREIDRISGRV